MFYRKGSPFLVSQGIHRHNSWAQTFPEIPPTAADIFPEIMQKEKVLSGSPKGREMEKRKAEACRT